MIILVYLAFLAIPLVAYSFGATISSGDVDSKRVQIWDILAVSLIWTCALLINHISLFSPWVILLVFIAIGITIGFLNSSIMRGSRRGALGQESRMNKEPSVTNNRFQNLCLFFQKANDFQGRILLGFVFLVIFMPISLIILVFSDFLNLRRSQRGSHWILKSVNPLNIEVHKKQF